jgi:hypothetical protein
MTTPDIASDTIAPPVKSTPLWEDFIDIFYAPSAVFERRRNANPWPMIIIITVVIVALSVLTFDSIVNVIEPMMRRGIDKAAAANPQVPRAALESQMRIGLKIAPWFPIITPILLLLGALVFWLVGKIFGSVAGYVQSLLIVTYACISFILSYLATGAQALLMDMTTLTSPLQLSMGPARFAPATTSPWVLGLLMTLDLFSIWRLALLAIGLHVIGRVSKNAAWIFALVMFLLMWLMNVRNAMQMVG